MEITADQVIGITAVGIAGITAISGGAAYVASLLVSKQVTSEIGKVRIEMQQDRVASMASHAEHLVTRHQVGELKETVSDHEDRIRALEERQ